MDGAAARSRRCDRPAAAATSARRSASISRSSECTPSGCCPFRSPAWRVGSTGTSAPAPPPCSSSIRYARTHALTHARTHSHTHACTHAPVCAEERSARRSYQAGTADNAILPIYALVTAGTCTPLSARRCPARPRALSGCVWPTYRVAIARPTYLRSVGIALPRGLQAADGTADPHVADRPNQARHPSRQAAARTLKPAAAVRSFLRPRPD